MAALLLPLFIFSQENIYSEKYNLKTNIKIDKIVTDRIESCKDGVHVYYTSRTAYDEKSRHIYQYDTTSKKVSLIELKHDKAYKKLYFERLVNFQVFKEKIFILTDDNIYVFKLDGKKATYIKTIKNKKYFRNIEVLNDNELALFINYKFHPLDSPDTHVWAKLDIPTLEIKDIKTMDDADTPFSFYVNRWYSVYKGYIAYAHTTDYTVYLYNQQFNKVDSIKSDLLEINKSYMKYLETADYDSKDGITKLNKLDDSLFTRIQKVFLLDSTHVLTVIKLPRTKHLELHLWAKHKGWELLKKQEISGVYDVGKEYTQKNNAVIGFYGNMNGITVMGNNIFVTYFPYLPNPVTKSFEWDKDYNEPTNEAIRTKELYYGIYKFYVPFN